MIPLTGHNKLNRILDDFQNEIRGTAGKRRKSEICAEATQEKFHLAVGQAYVKSQYYNKYYSMEFEQAEIMFENLKVAFTKFIENSRMSNFNKEMLKLKTKKTKLCLGYPPWMKNSLNQVESEYRGLIMNQSATFLEQSMNFNMWAVDKDYGLLTKQLWIHEHDTYECQWTKFPGYVGAHNDVVRNTVYLPIGILKPPFYNIYIPLASIYGKLGSILGHEILHGLEGPGLSELKNGSLTRTRKCLVNQYSKFSAEVLRKENVTLNGLKTLVENIADNAGLQGAYKAFKDTKLLRNELKSSRKKTEDFTDEQLFFLGFAQNWCESSTQTSLRTSIKTDKHPPGMFRVLGTLQNSQEFAVAWKCPLGSNMNPFREDHEKCKLF